MKEKILALLAHGVAVLSSDIENQLGISGKDVRKFIRELRRMGWPIASGSYGYRLDPGAIKETIQSLRARAKDMTLTANLMETLNAHHQIGMSL